MEEKGVLTTRAALGLAADLDEELGAGSGLGAVAT